ncbi:MAG: [Fe-Fe] hydrogenase large subunit C-terminal domain-containing protein [Bacillota bacterium]|jgi:anti-sigma regulatory factor (Ser/Thr protein kinase)/Fe-S-cluster-containing hydrogenase component 2
MVGLTHDPHVLFEVAFSRGEFARIGEETSGLKRSLLGIGFPAEASRRALIAAYELGMNIIIHARKGRLRLSWKDGQVEITAEDTGPGIPDIPLAMKEGYSTAPDHIREMGYGAGMGLPNARKASDAFHIESQVGKGTKIVCAVSPGPTDLQASGYFHSVRLDPTRCKGCTNCIKGCPTEAIRVRDGKAFILEDRCIDCGECIRRCTNMAKTAVSDPWEALATLDYKIALIPPSFYGAFSDMTPDEVRAALLAPQGFDEVFDVSVAADLCSQMMRDYISKRPGEGPFISPACPAVLRLIQVKYPSLLERVIPCEAPMEVASWLAKTKMERPRPVKNPSTVFISPCPAKITASRQPVGRGRSLVDASISASHAFLWVRDHKGSPLPQGLSPFPDSSGLGIGWGRSGGELAAVGLTGLAVDGIAHVPAVLDEMENGSLDGRVDFIEMQACTGGCVGGCLHAANPFVSRMRLRQLVVEHGDSRPHRVVQETGTDRPELWLSLALLPRPIFRLDADPERAEAKLSEIKSIERSLPGLDCGACGAPTCRSLAEDIVLGRGSEWDCTFKLRERLAGLAEEVVALAAQRPPAMAGPGDDTVTKEGAGIDACR